jgi:phosphate transport system ATP-binding protein
MTEIYPHKIESKDVNLYYENFHALKGISMSVEKNTVCALIGPSGC